MNVSPIIFFFSFNSPAVFKEVAPLLRDSVKEDKIAINNQILEAIVFFR